jgi:hypothetical protein
MIEQEQFDPEKMSPREEVACARDFRDITHENLQHSSGRGSELADEFTRLEVQIATILFAFAGAFLTTLKGAVLSTSFDPLGIFMLKLAIAASFFFLLLSLISGLLHIKRKEKFWDEILLQRSARFDEWDKVVRKKIPFEQGLSFHMGTIAGHDKVLTSPLWTWVLQTIFLGIAVALLFLLAVIILFS